MLLKELVKRKIITSEKEKLIREEAEFSKKSVEEIILKERLLKEDELFKIKSEILKIPFKKIDPKEVSEKILSLIPKETAEFYYVVPVKEEKNKVLVGMVFPENWRAREALNFTSRVLKIDFEIFLLSLSNFKEILKKYEKVSGKEEEIKEIVEKIKEEEIKPVEKLEEIEKTVAEAPISKIVSSILKFAVEGNATDIHIEPQRDNLRVRFRSLGILHTSLVLPLKIHPAVVSRIKILSNLRIDETRIPQDGRFSAKVSGKNLDFRVSTFPTVFGEKVELRILDPSTGLKKLEELGFEKENQKTIEEAIKKTQGIILVCGPTGSGKTTTLYAILQRLNKEGVNIVTLEDPVEYTIDGINQSQIRPEIGYDFAKGLRHILRQDPNIIMVGEIRDKESAFLATQAALTGHLVLSTLHTNDAISALPRLLDLGVPPFLIPPTVSLVLSQRLIRVLCEKCKQKTKATKEEREVLENYLERKLEGEVFLFKPKGCEECKQTGYARREAICEILKMTPEISKIVLEGFDEEKVKTAAKKQGMRTLIQDGMLKVLEGKTTLEEVLRVVRE